MAMFRRSPKSSPPLRRRQEEIARQEADLRERLEKLERLVAKVPDDRRKTGRNKDQTIIEPINDSASRLRRKTSAKAERSGRPRSLRKERRDGQIIFLLLMVALAAAVIWLISNLHS